MLSMDIFKFDNPQPKCEQGGMLIAHPFLQESYFQRGCICIVDKESDEAPTTGLVLNKVTNLFLNDIVDEIHSSEQIPIFCGGPLSLDRLFFIHDNPNIPESQFVKEGLYFNGDFNSILEYINSGQPIGDHVKFFIGYSGWEKFQLAGEIQKHVWAVDNKVEPKFFLKAGSTDLWNDSVKSLGDDYKSWLLCPIDPSLN